jgi:hypothetical protein
MKNIITVIAIALLSTGVIVAWMPGRPAPQEPLTAVPALPTLTAGELAAMPDRDLLERLNQECLRRFYAADCRYRDLDAIMPRKAGALWIVANMEGQITMVGIPALLAMERDPRQTPTSPSLEQTAAAYDTIGLPKIAEMLRSAAAVPDPTGEKNGRLDDLQSRCRALIGSGTQAKRLAYAKANRADLLAGP